MCQIMIYTNWKWALKFIHVFQNSSFICFTAIMLQYIRDPIRSVFYRLPAVCQPFTFRYLCMLLHINIIKFIVLSAIANLIPYEKQKNEKNFTSKVQANLKRLRNPCVLEKRKFNIVVAIAIALSLL
jgi:hypothetical protein